DLQLIITMINGVIDIVTIALIAFTALALVVSTVMIGIITYVSVMERVKEIGVIRSLGGRKNDVSNLFIAETFMIGGMSGIFGIAMTYVFELVLNLTVGVTFKLGMIANLSVLTALLVILVSILLTMIAGLTPARSASRQDPVVALRSE
ncbi:MAG: FtsX-like permease family protein, partial [Bacilli bacterium]|nr:FtsX-like permease family protein [Bacilli bacterium]